MHVDISSALSRLPSEHRRMSTMRRNIFSYLKDLVGNSTPAVEALGDDKIKLMRTEVDDYVYIYLLNMGIT